MIQAARLLLAVFALLCAGAACNENPFDSGGLLSDKGTEKSADELLADAIDSPKPARTFESRKTDGAHCSNTFAVFKEAARRAGRGTREAEQWHHIVNQHDANKARFGTRLHCTDNLIRIPKRTHEAITGHYNSKDPGAGSLVREVVGKRSWLEQYQYGLRLLRQHGIEP